MDYVYCKTHRVGQTFVHIVAKINSDQYQRKTCPVSFI